MEHGHKCDKQRHDDACDAAEVNASTVEAVAEQDSAHQHCKLKPLLAVHTSVLSRARSSVTPSVDGAMS
jgi:hypothetical protein